MESLTIGHGATARISNRIEPCPNCKQGDFLVYITYKNVEKGYCAPCLKASGFEFNRKDDSK